jgi:hypothetical protein
VGMGLETTGRAARRHLGATWPGGINVQQATWNMVCGTWGKDGGHRRGKGGATNRVAARNRFGGRTAEVTLETCSYVRGSQTKWDSKDKR